MRRYTVNVEPRGDRWQARIYLEGEGGKSRRFSTGVLIGDNRAVSKRAAKAAAYERAKELSREVPLVKGTVRGGKNSLKEVASRMIAQKQTDKRRPRAVQSLAFQLDKHVFKFFGEHKSVTEIRRRDVEGFKSHMAQNYKPTTVNNALTAIRQVLKHACYVDESIESVPVIANLPTDNRGSGMPITIEQAQLFLASFADDEVDEREYHQFLFDTGLRKAETLAMQWSWIDWDARVIRIPGEYRKGGKEQRIPTTMTADVYKLLRARQKRPRQPANDRVWFLLKACKSQPGRDYDQARARAAAKAGIPGFRAHDARHTRASILAANGATEMDLRDAMNWETTAMANRYTHPTHDRVKQLAATVQISRPSHTKPSHGRKKTPSATVR